MSSVVELLRSRRAPQVAVLALMSVAFAGCSADMSSRFSQSSYSQNPFAFDPQPTGAVQAPPRELPQYARPHSQYPQYQSQPLPPPVSAPQSYPVSSGVSGGGRGIASYAPPPARPQIEATGAVPHSVAAAHNGTTIIVGTSDTLEVLAKRYHVSTAEILRANGYKGPRALSPGQQLIIPRSTATAMAAPATKPVAVAAAPAGVYYVNRGDTLHSIARQHHISVVELARANNLDQSARLSLGMKLMVPGAKTAAAAPAVAAVAPAPVPALAVPKVVATAQPQQSARLVQPTANVEQPAAAAETPAVKSSEATGALPTFRWPVRGKVITAYGTKTNGKVNDGINVAVPEGTPVKAAEDGVVAYSGNELKGYGNLVLIRHPNGYVTAYAHASELLVKRGDTIKRGQVIAKSGQSGEVGSPQLHFEIRKGSSPVDPLQFLNGA
ncbi:peptidoglycan DD-metalloendopeptidase family protein [Bradyrhizobium sp. ISRA443]|uniref:peptidoglycan DD-metalloendopeptidase family protein n=1 Tax=unclassified Bradyrhizobium TaxID=2631580 RepID=UPI00247B135D|nr:MULTISPECIES: peptidoglycan DD-metalloendopeptidase family protein [unclassified Bradyrhizobium]WGR92034.1 peptidoglycan DD-metalloendopeptidase family protein [Bradyrhizobium sp. ISRA435]WGS02471.1 peptidoglycan DD-metalloendopeptidase family protein [Bradyrhizobium sp. ISRA436]WGS09356.1 peptidoglycan DD-metalloendopeptidase family protein [Bradyrhizobium sp. ISRA437]WGS16245.1 peptidoglycan DD-metalloendopeptidase family protein [Bradyrhizobium sp. ISRA443]